MNIHPPFRSWLISVSKSGEANSDLAQEILKHISSSDVGMNSVGRALYRAGVLDALQGSLNILEKAFSASMQATYRAEQIELAKAKGLYTGNPLLHTKTESLDPNYLTATQLAKKYFVKPTTVVYRARKGKESFENWTLVNFGEAWSFTECEANYGLGSVRRFFRVKLD